MRTYSKLKTFVRRPVRTWVKVSSAFVFLIVMLLVLEFMAAGIITIYISSTFNSFQIDEYNELYRKNSYKRSPMSLYLHDRKISFVNKTNASSIEYEIIPTEHESRMHQIGQDTMKAKLDSIRKQDYLNSTARHPSNRKIRKTAYPYEIRIRWKAYKTQLKLHSELLSKVNLTKWDTWNCTKCFDNQFHFLNPSKICAVAGSESAGDVDLLVIVTSQAKNIENRMALRRTWLSLAKNNTSNMRYIFFLGRIEDAEDARNISKENLQFNDIVIGNFTDHYDYLTTKTVAGIYWTNKYCPNSKYFLKTDDDMWVNTEKILSMLQKIPDSGFVGGACLPRAKPIRTLTGTLRKFYLPYTDFLFKFYPPYCQGLGILVSQDIVRAVSSISQNTPFFKFEDVYLGLCFAKLRVRLNLIPAFKDRLYDHYTKYYNMTTCDLKGDEFVTVHKVPIHVMELAWNAACT